MNYILPGITLVLLTAGLIIQKRNRSPYAGVPMDAQAITNYRRGEVLSFLGTVCFMIHILFL